MSDYSLISIIPRTVCSWDSLVHREPTAKDVIEFLEKNPDLAWAVVSDLAPRIMCPWERPEQPCRQAFKRRHYSSIGIGMTEDYKKREMAKADVQLRKDGYLLADGKDIDCESCGASMVNLRHCQGCEGMDEG